jgi:streptomycin 6-kinase
MSEVYADAGRAWIDRLPSIIAACAERWSLEVQPPFPLSYNYVAPCRCQDGACVVLKVGYPSKEFFNEMAALRHFDGHGIAALIEGDETLGAMLIERLEPGDLLDARIDDVAATSAAAGVMRNLWRPLPATHSFPTVGDWGKGFERLRTAFAGGTGPFPEALVAQAEELFASLSATAAESALLHGDLHHGNILSARRAPWLAIDPKGLAGEPAYETGALLRNPAPDFSDWPDAAVATARRVAQLADELGFDRDRVRGWGVAQAVLSAWWTWEDHGRVGHYALACARFIADTPA